MRYSYDSGDGGGWGGDPMTIVSNRQNLAVRRSTLDKLARWNIRIPSVGFMDLDAVSAALSAAEASDIDRVTVVTTLAMCQLFDVGGTEDRLIRDRIAAGLAA